LAETTEELWVLGGKASNADLSIPWKEEIPNLSNCDRLIVDLNTIPAGISIPIYEIRDYVRRMLMAGKTVYVILSNDWFKAPYILSDSFPIFPHLVNVKPCSFAGDIRTGQDIPDEITEYSKYFDSCSFFINEMDYNYLRSYLFPNVSGFTNVEKYPFSSKLMYFEPFRKFEILNVSKQVIGLSASFCLSDSRRDLLSNGGDIVFLPPPTSITYSEAVDVLVNTLVGVDIREEEPEWSKKINLPQVSALIQQAASENKIIEEAKQKIEQLNKMRNEIEEHKKLLWTYDKPLENAVRGAFVLLDFGEIRQGRSKELEDWIIDFQTTKKFVHGVLEVKGSVKKTSLADMNQCDKWVKEYFISEKKIVKGIFIPNQFRRTENEDPKLRLKFEPNEIEFAKRFQLCVLPTVELFKAVVHVLNGNKLPRDEIEKRILEAKPICKLVD
jgi:hypothetical protein